MGESPQRNLTSEQIWHLIEVADNFLKHGDDHRSVGRARKRLQEAVGAAERAGLSALANQARKRLDDLDESPS